MIVYNAVLFFAVQQNESVMQRTYILFFWISFPSRLPQNIESGLSLHSFFMSNVLFYFYWSRSDVQFL